MSTVEELYISYTMTQAVLTYHVPEIRGYIQEMTLSLKVSVITGLESDISCSTMTPLISLN